MECYISLGNRYIERQLDLEKRDVAGPMSVAKHYAQGQSYFKIHDAEGYISFEIITQRLPFPFNNNTLRSNFLSIMATNGNLQYFEN